MLDEFRQQAADSFPEEEFTPPPRKRQSRFLGLTPPQLFMISLLLLVLTCVIGSAFLIVMGRVVLG